MDSAVRSGSIVPPYYDSLIAKLIVWGPNRDVAIQRARQALKEFDISGVRTVLPFHRDMLEEQALVGKELGVYTDWLDKHYRPSGPREATPVDAIYTQRRNIAVEIDGKLVNVGLPMEFFNAAAAGAAAGQTPSSAAPSAAGTQASDPNAVTSNFDANLVAFNAENGATVAEGDAIATVEAMKMESTIKAHRAGKVTLVAAAGDRVTPTTVIATID